MRYHNLFPLETSGEGVGTAVEAIYGTTWATAAFPQPVLYRSIGCRAQGKTTCLLFSQSTNIFGRPCHALGRREWERWEERCLACQQIMTACARARMETPGKDKRECLGNARETEREREREKQQKELPRKLCGAVRPKRKREVRAKGPIRKGCHCAPLPLHSPHLDGSTLA